MSKYSVFYAADVSCYLDEFEIKAANDEAALEIARLSFERVSHRLEPDYGTGFSNERIVEIKNENGETVRADEEIYPVAGANDAVSPAPKSQQPVNVQVLKAMLDLLAIAEQGDPADEEERTTLEAARAAARAAKAEACVPCPDCTAAEQLCESCGGHGFVPKTPASLRVLCHVSGGVASLAYDFGIEHVIADADEGGPIDIPAGWEDLAEQLGIETDDENDDECNTVTCSSCGNEVADRDAQSLPEGGCVCHKCGGDRDADTSDAMQPGDTLCASCDAEERDETCDCERCGKPATDEAATGEFLCPSCMAKVANS